MDNVIADKTINYNRNPNLKKIGVPIEYSKEQFVELAICSENPIYFIENYVKIVTLDFGIQPFNLWDFQREFIELVHNNRMVLALQSRQSAKCHTKNMVFTIRNKNTGEIKNVTAKDFHETISQSL